MAYLSIFRGDSKTIRITVTDELGVAVDLTGWKVFFTAKESETDSDDDAVIKIDVDPTDPTNGIADIDFEPADTNDLTPADYIYDIQVIKDNGDVVTFIKDKLRIVADITRRVIADGK